ncbi:MAG: hypothetical protein OEW78_08370 [Nitrosopumilus sp.]|uniref:hypothetical protein n=1 Tax=Nitrosopumilus sp. TaxID=2024843 RepID=UPI00246BCB6C|nr:hypothetical protein [Nitrosopumilus sp.]MDH5431876.1 hypothetical protein [Nitrosopumilus sp.]
MAVGIYLVSSAFVGGFLSIMDPMDYGHTYFEILTALQASVGIMLVFGLFVRIGSAMLICIFAFSFVEYGLNALDQIMLLGVSFALLLRTSSKYSVDNLLLKRKNISSTQKFDINRMFLPAIGITFGANLVWLGLVEKLLAPNMFATVLKEYGLSPVGMSVDMAVFGAGLVEIVIGLFYMFGIRMRMVSAIMLGVLVSTVVVFQENMIAHIVMFAIVVMFVINNKDPITGIKMEKILPIIRKMKNVMLLRMYAN